MATVSKAAGMCAWAIAAIGLPSTVVAQASLRDRVQAAVDAVESTCTADIARFCGTVTRGEGRVLLCLQAFDDQLSRRCQFGLYRAARNLERSLDRVERIADACWSDIEANCPNADRVGQCLIEKTQSLSPTCRSVIDRVQQTLANLPSLRGLAVLSAENEEVGRVVEVVRDENGRIQALQVDIGSFLGVGGRTISIDANSFEHLGNKIRISLTGEALRSAPPASR
jgi:PRC-barrel domain/Cysteine rich repeat